MISYVEVKRDKYILRGLKNTPKDVKGVLVMFHGFTGHLNENGYFFKKLAEDLLEIGIETYRFDFMGSGMSDGEFKDMTFFTEVEDAKSILDYVIKENPDKKIYALGFSCGGAVLGLIAAKYQDKLSKIILCSPAGDMDKIGDSYLNNPHVIWYDENNIDMGGYLMSKKFIDTLKGVDLYETIHEFKKPVLITHGELDMSVPIEYGMRYRDLLENVDFHIIKGSSHCYTKMEYRKEVNQAIIDFLK